MTVGDFLELYDKESVVWVFDDATEKCIYDSEEDNYVDDRVLQIAIQGIEEGARGGVCIKVNTRNLPEYNTRKFLENFRNEFNNQIRPCITDETLKKWCIDLNDYKLFFCSSEVKAIKDIRECVNKIEDVLNEYFKE